MFLSTRGRNAADDAVGRHIFGHYGTGGHDGVFAHRHAGQNGGARAAVKRQVDVQTVVNLCAGDVGQQGADLFLRFVCAGKFGDFGRVFGHDAVDISKFGRIGRDDTVGRKALHDVSLRPSERRNACLKEFFRQAYRVISLFSLQHNFH